MYCGFMNPPDRGQVANLVPAAVVETLGTMGAEGAHGQDCGELWQACRAL